MGEPQIFATGGEGQDTRKGLSLPYAVARVG